MRLRSQWWSAIWTLVVIVLTGCGPAVSPAANVTSPSEAPTPSAAASSPSGTIGPSSGAPVGIIAVGHSGLTGEGTGGIYEARPENSWATGTSPAVNSVYLRLLSVRPETEDHLANTAMGGASASTLADQVGRALRQVPYPALAIISTVDNDIRCDGTDDAHIPEFGAQVKAALEQIHEASPNTHMLVVGQPGRPSIPFIETLVAAVPDQREALTGTGMCDFFDPDGTLVEDNVVTLTGIIDAYEVEQARVCAEVPNCVTDGGVRAAYVDTLDNFAPDYAHLNVAGQAAEAELIWPVAQELLGL